MVSLCSQYLLTLAQTLSRVVRWVPTSLSLSSTLSSLPQKENVERRLELMRVLSLVEGRRRKTVQLAGWACILQACQQEGTISLSHVSLSSGLPWTGDSPLLLPTEGTPC